MKQSKTKNRIQDQIGDRPYLIDEFENFYRSSPNGLCLLDDKMRFVRVNKRLAEINQVPVKDHIGRKLSSVMPEVAADFDSLCRQIIKSGEPVIERDLDRIREGQDTPVQKLRVSCFPIKDVAHNVRAVNMIIQEITTMISAQKQVEERLAFETLLSELSANFVNLPSEKVGKEIENSLQRVAEFLDVDRAELTELTPENEISLQYSYTSPAFSKKYKKIVKNYLVVDRSLPWYAAQLHAGKIVMNTDPESFPPEATEEREYFKKSGVKSSFTIPLMVGGKLKYTIILESYRTRRQWPEELVTRLQLIGEIFANAMERRKADETLQKAFVEIKELKSQIEAEWSYLQEEIKLEHNFEDIIGQSKELQYVLFKIEQIVQLDTTVLILGETGTGKELIARAIHNLGPRSKRPMVKVNCAALPSNLIESELFGHEKGAFSGAHVRKVGRFELANGSSLFLDEIGELPPELQPKLLRVLQDGEFERLGGSQTIRTDVRLITATNRELEEEVKNNRFREDLFYRLNVFPITAPPLRQRKNDIALLVNHFVQKFCKKTGKTIDKVPAKTLKTLERYHWPGNVRELENVIERAVINTMNRSLRLADRLEPDPDHGFTDGPLKTLEDMERDHIIEALEQTNGRVYGPRGAALILGINPETLRFRIRKLGIQKKYIKK